MRDQKLLSIRPELNLTSASEELSIESFQNEVLRPILNFQNNLTLQLLLQSKHYEDKDMKGDSARFLKYLKKYVNSNKVFRIQLLGIVIGMLTESEFQFYSDNQKEFNKRIIQMQINRFIDQLGKS